MKRKAETSILPPVKKAKTDPESIVLRLLKEHGKNISLAHLQNVFPKLSIAFCHEILKMLKDNPEFNLLGAYVLIEDLFLYLLTQDYADTDPSIINLCDLLFDYKNCHKLPLFRGEIYNNWLQKLNLDSANNFQNFHHFLQILGQLVFLKHIDFSDKIDCINIDIINDYLIRFNKKDSETKENLTELRCAIIQSVENLTQGNNFIGQLNTDLVEGLLGIDPQEMPPAQDIAQIFIFMGYLIERGVFSKKVSTALLEEYLVYVAQNDAIENSSKVFSIFVPKFALQKHYEHQAFKAEVLQCLIDLVINSQMDSLSLANFFVQLGRLGKAKLIQGHIDGIEKILHKINVDKVNAEMISKLYLGLMGMTPFLKNRINTYFVQKFMVEKLRSDIKFMSISYNAVYCLAAESKLKGVFGEEFFEHVHFYANCQSRNLDPKLVTDIISAIGICLLNGHLQFYLNSELLEKLLEQFSQMKANTQHIVHVGFALQNIANSKKFRGIFQGKLFDNFLQTLLINSKNINNIATFLYSLGHVARKGYLKEELPQNTLIQVLNKLRSAKQIRTIFVLKSLIGISDLLAKSALQIEEKYLEETCCEILLNNDENWEDLHQVNGYDIVQILQLPAPLSGKILHKLLPVFLKIMNHQPNIMVVNEVFDALHKLAKSQNLPRMNAKDLQHLFEVFSKINIKYTQSVLKAFSILVHLAEMKLLTGSLDLKQLKRPLLEICDEQLEDQKLTEIELSDIATLLNQIDCLESQIYLDGEIDILPRIMQLIVINLHQNQILDINALAEIFNSIQKLVKKEIIINTDNKYDVMEDILKAVLTVPNLEKEHLVSILNGLCCLIEYELYNGSIDAVVIYSLLLKLDSKELSRMYHENLYFLFNDKNLYSTRRELQQPTPSQALRHLFFQPVQTSSDDQQNCTSACSSPSSTELN